MANTPLIFGDGIQVDDSTGQAILSNYQDVSGSSFTIHLSTGGTSVTGGPYRWTRIGNLVVFSGSVSATVTSGTPLTADFSLPFTPTYDVLETCYRKANPSNTGTVTNIYAPSPVVGRVQLLITPTSTGGHSFNFRITYLV